jgi:hypothetical protein
MAVVENLMLLALKEDGSPLVSHLQLEYGLAAGLLIDLARDGRIDVEGDTVVVGDSSPSGSADENAALARIVAEKPHDLQDRTGDAVAKVIMHVEAVVVAPVLTAGASA